MTADSAGKRFARRGARERQHRRRHSRQHSRRHPRHGDLCGLSRAASSGSVSCGTRTAAGAARKGRKPTALGWSSSSFDGDIATTLGESRTPLANHLILLLPYVAHIRVDVAGIGTPSSVDPCAGAEVWGEIFAHGQERG
jgi:hypothetical protein